MWELLKRLTSTRYVNMLETEVSRLRAENRALMNSILGIAGMPPLPASAVSEAGTIHAVPSNRASYGAPSSRPASGRAQLASPMRRRSWQQINKALEFEYGRKKEPGDGVTLPVAQKGSSK
jgi:hypothetical protein